MKEKETDPKGSTVPVVHQGRATQEKAMTTVDGNSSKRTPKIAECFTFRDL